MLNGTLHLSSSRVVRALRLAALPTASGSTADVPRMRNHPIEALPSYRPDHSFTIEFAFGLATGDRNASTPSAWNDAHYGGRNLLPPDILIRKTAKSPKSTALLAEITKATN